MNTERKNPLYTIDEEDDEKRLDTKPVTGRLEEYNINTIDFPGKVPNTTITTVKKTFYIPNPKLHEKLNKLLDNLKITTNILDIGCGSTPFSKATHLLDFNYSHSGKIIFKADIDFERIPYPDKYFNYVYCRHTLEDIQNPQHAFSEITRLTDMGYIETPSPLVEVLKNVESKDHRGYIHHRYIVWSDPETNTLNFLPKYPIIEHITIDSMLQKYTYLANNLPVYWNNYYIWDKQIPPKINVYRNDINFDIRDEYANLLNQAVISSIRYTNAFMDLMSKVN